MIVEKLKCFGGIANGQVVGFERDQREVMLTERVPAGLPRLRTGSLASYSMTVTQMRYTRRIIKIGDEFVVAYLAPAEWSDARALRYALLP